MICNIFFILSRYQIYVRYIVNKIIFIFINQRITYLGGMPGLQNVMRQLQQGAGGGLGNIMGGLGK